MCGIAGIFNIDQPRSISLNTLGKMAFALHHRGPDETGVYIDDWIGLGQTRLSIIDINGGSQPIDNEDSSLWIVFNGEIFNYPELRNDLINKGHVFKTHTDTEVILHLYEEKGEKCLEELNGQFAFAIWNFNKHELFLARDRYGILPLYYSEQNGQLLFASEIKSIFNADNVRRDFNFQVLDQIFTFWSPLPGSTIFKGINELAPGHYLKVSDKHISINKYWDFKPSVQNDNFSIPISEITENLSELIIDAVKIRLRADVPVGSYLSGGLDSSGITALIKKYFNNDLRTFGIRFEEKSFDEGDFQSKVVKYLGINHTEVNTLNNDIGKYFDSVLFHTEQPVLRVSPVPLYLLSESVNRNNYKVVLTGEGADEIFGGYDIFKETKIRKFWSANPQSQIRPELFDSIYPYIFKDKRLKKTLSAFFKNGIEDPDNVFFSHLIRWANGIKIKNLFSDDLKYKLKDINCIEEFKNYLPDDFRSWDYLSKAQYIEIKLFMSGYLLNSQGDRVAMAHSVELRPPYLDHRLMDFMTKIPPYIKLYGLNEKLLLKKVFKDLLPADIVRRPKNPYRAPIRQGLISQNDSLIEKYCTSENLERANIFNSKMIDKLFTKARKSDALSEIDSMAVAGIISTQIIYEKFIRNFNKVENNNFKFDIVFDKRKIFGVN